MNAVEKKKLNAQQKCKDVTPRIKRTTILEIE